MDLAAYLRRIGIDGGVDASVETLRRLHLAHLRSVPFENLDIRLERRFGIRPADVYAKLVTARRGGFCYEQNGVFAWALSEIGFEVDRLSARVYSGGAPGPEFDHMLLRVRVPAAEKPEWLADVGFGELFLEPVPLVAGETTESDPAAGITTHTLVDEGRTWTLLRRKPGVEAEPQYRFSTRARRTEEFEAMSIHHQTSPESHFTRRTLITIATVQGRTTFTDGRLIETTAAGRAERPVSSTDEAESILRETFEVELPNDVDLARLFSLS